MLRAIGTGYYETEEDESAECASSEARAAFYTRALVKDRRGSGRSYEVDIKISPSQNLRTPVLRLYIFTLL